MSRILVIDDSVLISELLREGLTHAGFEVVLAMDANQGYATAIECQPDLILLDVQLPDVAGSDLIAILKNRDDLQHIPIIMITGTHYQTEHKIKALKAGADDYVLKPFEMPELLERIKAVLRRSKKNPSSSAVPYSPPKSLKVDSPPAVAPPTPLSLKEVIVRTFADPRSLEGVVYPPVTMIYLATLLGLSLGAWALSRGSTVKPALIVVGVPGFWGLGVAFLVMACSIMGISLTWKDGARLMCVAGLPLLLKYAGACMATAATSLSPFYFTASPAVFLKTAPLYVERLDVFELWMVWLVSVLVKQCKGSSKEKAWITAGVVWPVVACWQSLWKH